MNKPIHIFRMIFKCGYCEKKLQEIGFSFKNIEGLFGFMDENSKNHSIPPCKGCKQNIKITYICSVEENE